MSELCMTNKRHCPPRKTMGEEIATNATDDSTTSAPVCDPGEEKVIRLNAGKAGMENLDLDKINTIINNTSRGSKFYEHKRKRQEQLNQKVTEMQAQLAALSPEAIAKAEKQVELMGKQMEERRDLSRIIVHLDMDAFFAAVEMRDDPSLKDVPMAVGSMSMLSTSNYHARRYGVRAAMPGFIAKKLCPNLIIVPIHFDKYLAASKEVEKVLLEYDKETLSMSMDEAVIDITQCLVERNSLISEQSQITVSELVKEMRNKVFEKTKLTASCGIAANGFLAKICSDVNKPNNQYYLEPTVEAIDNFLKNLPIRKVCGIGPVTEHLLKGLDINTCHDLWVKRGIINLLFKPATASFLLAVSKGVGASFFSFAPESEDIRKSISCEMTFGNATSADLKQICMDISEELEKDLVKKGATGKTITLKIKTVDFEVKTRTRSIAEYTSSSEIMFKTAWSIYTSYENEIPGLKLRLIGLRVSNLRFISEEDEDDTTMKQQTLSQMFSKSNQSESFGPKTYACPCCGQECTSMRELEVHIDECLINSETESPEDTKKATALSKEEHPLKISPTIPGTNKNLVMAVPCPICNRKIRIDNKNEIEAKMNVHIDECLNMSVVREIVERDRKSYENVIPVPSVSSPVSSISSLAPLTSSPTLSIVSPMKRPLETTETKEITPRSEPNSSSGKNNPKNKKQKLQLPIDAFFMRDS